MAKKLIIETEVKTDGIDKAQAKLGQLKDLGRGLKIQYSIDGKPLDVVIDKSKNLQQQVKILTSELRRTKEGTAEFQLLSSKLGDAQDQLSKTTAKSKDLFTSLSMIPGPVGQFFSQLQGGIELLKTFSSFSLKDLSFQFKETANDIADIGKNISGIDSDNLDNVGENIDNVEKSSSKLGENLKSTTAEVGGLSATLNKSGQDWVNYDKAVGDLYKNTGLIITQYPKMVNGVEVMTDAVRINSKTIRDLSQSELMAINSGKALTLTTEGLIVAEQQATFWTTAFGTALKGALIGTGIGIAIVLIGEIVSKLLSYFDSSKKAEKAANDFTEAIKYQNEILEANLGQIDFENKKKLLQAKIAGQSEKELNEITQQGLENRLNLIKKANSAALLEQQNLAKRVGKYAEISDEERAALLEKNLENLKKLGDEETKAREAVELGKLQIQATAAEKSREGLKKTGEQITNDNKKIQEQIKADTIKANDLLLKLQQENNVNKLDTERKRQDEQLKIDKSNEEREINKLFQIEGKKTQLTVEQEKIKSDLLEQVRVKYGIKVIDINKKRQEEDNKIFDEDQKKIKEYQDKVFEIMNAADENELSRNKATRQRKYEDDVEALQKDANFQKQSLEEKIRILMALEKGFKQDIQKLDDDDAAKTREKASKKLDDELKFLQIRGEALREGTKQFFNNQRDILKTAEKKELNDLKDRAIAEKLTTEQVEAEKLAIKEKYAKERSDIDKQELDQYLQYATTVLSAASSIFSQISQVNALEQQVASERLTKAYIEQNELDKKNITNKEEQEKKLLENKKKFAKDEDELKKKAFEDNKKIQIAQAIIGTLQGAVQAYQSLAVIPVVGPALGAVAAAAALVFGYKQVDLIKKTTYQSPVALADSETPSATTKTNYGRNYAKGGMIGGKRHAEGGTLIEAEKGEAIMTRGAVTMFAPLLSMMNQAGGGTSFNSNLMTTRQDNPIVNNPAQEQSPLIVKTYVVSQELTTEAERQARLKNLSTI